jgi:RNA polymerase sigma-70 factor (ECF subfamily)
MELTLRNPFAAISDEATDASLVRSALAGDEEAFVRLVRQYERMVFGLAARMLGSEEDAEDVTQETFLRLLRHLRKLRFETKLSTWLYHVTYNLCVDLERKRRRERRADEGESGVNGEQPDDRDEPWEQVRADSVRADVEGALQQLPDSYRAVLILRYFDSLPYEEIARAMGLTPKKVKARLFCARQRLRELLTEEGEA